MSLTFLDLKLANRDRCEESFHHTIDEWSPTDWATAFGGEAGEALNQIKKLRRMVVKADDYDPLISAQVAQAWRAILEAADAVIYADLLAQRLGFTFEDAVRHAFNAKSQEIGSTVML